LDNLEILELKEINWFVQDNESFHFININKLYIVYTMSFNWKFHIKSKYFFEEFLKGNIKWKKLKELEIQMIYGTKPEYNKEYINKDIIDFKK